MIIGDELKKLLTNSDNEIARKILALSSEQEDFVGGIDYINIAIENPNRISFITKDRKERFLMDNPEKDCLPTGTKVKLKKSSEYYHQMSGEGIITGHNMWLNFQYRIEWENSTSYYYNARDIAYHDRLLKKLNKNKKIFDIWNNELRVKYAYMTSPGKFIRKLPIVISDKEVEEFSRLFLKDEICLKVENVYFDLVKGEDIRECYLEDNYLDGYGSLGRSCMRERKCQEYLDPYVNNPDNVSLLTLKDIITDKVRGRAIVWKCFKKDSDEEITLMDRIYTSNSAHEEFFKVYAVKKGWYYKYRQSTCAEMELCTPSEKLVNEQLYVVLNIEEDSSFPYMDTMCVGNWKEKGKTMTLSNSSLGRYECSLRETNGGPLRTDGVYSEWHGETIPEEDAVYSEYMSDWIYYDDAVELRHGGYIADSHDDLVKINGYYYLGEYCTYSDYYEQYIHKDFGEIVQLRDGRDIYAEDAIYSEYYEEYILEEDSVYSEYHKCFILSDDAVEYNGDWIHQDDYEELIELEKEKEEIDA